MYKNYKTTHNRHVDIATVQGSVASFGLHEAWYIQDSVMTINVYYICMTTLNDVTGL